MTAQSAGTTAPTSHARLTAWVTEVAELTQPDRVVWCDGSDEEWTRLTDELVAAGTLVQLDEAKKPNSFWCASDPTDVARVEDRTYICSRGQGRRRRHEQLDGPGRDEVGDDRPLPRLDARPDHVRHPVLHGPARGGVPDVRRRDHRLGVRRVLDADHGPDGQQGARPDGQRTPTSCPACTRWARRSSPASRTSPWPCNDTKYITQFPEERAIWSFGSGYGGNALLGKKCFSLRIASAMARDEGWLAEHMLILKLTSPEQAVHYVAAAFPSACGKTNLAMLDPTLEGWKVETLGDDIAWMRFGEDGRLYALNPEYGLFGVAPGTGWGTNPNAMRTIAKGNSLFTNVALTDDGDIWWEGMTDEPPAHLTDWKGRDWTPDSDEPSSAPQLTVLHADHPVPDHRARVRRPARRADLGDPVRRPPQDDHPAGLRGPRLGARRLHGRHPVVRDDGRRDRRRSASCAATRWRCCRSSATTPATTSATGSSMGKEGDAAEAAEDLLRQLVPPRRGRRLPLAGLRRERPGPQVGHRADRGPGGRGRDGHRAGPDGRLAGRRPGWT